jgi:hypothetical protein
MSEERLGLRFLVEVGLSYVEGIFPNIDTTLYDQLGQIFSAYLRGRMPYEVAHQYFLSILGRVDPLTHIRDIAQLRDEPIPSNDGQSQDSGEEGHNRKKTRTWTAYEDQRLIAGIFRYGLDNWTLVAEFVGNNRTRAQCSQRWSRGLDPRICKKHWSSEEDAQLISLVRTYGEKAWTKIASCLGNRSDVQCRYHYRQITKDGQPQPNAYNSAPSTNKSSLPSSTVTNPRLGASPSVYTPAHMGIGQRMPLVLDRSQQSMISPMATTASRITMTPIISSIPIAVMSNIPPQIQAQPSSGLILPQQQQKEARMNSAVTIQTNAQPIHHAPGLDSFLGHFKN